MGWLATITRIPAPRRFDRYAGIVQSVYVVPEWRRRGVGRRIVTLVIDTARARAFEYLLVHPAPASIPFYRAMGFAPPERQMRLELQR